MNDNMTYQASGVDIEAGNRLVELIKPLVRSTARKGAGANIGGFAGLFDPKAAGFKDPLLMVATDGVGSKLKIAAEMNDYTSIGIDLVAMCVNDLLVRGVEPVAFLDYYACGHLDVKKGKKLIRSIVKGCRMAGCALVGGETAEMPGVYNNDDYDLAGFVVGAVERDNLLDERGGKAGDIILGLKSSGLHANGFSLIRKFLSDKGIDLNDSLPSKITNRNSKWGKFLLRPTRIYTKSVLSVLEKHNIKAMSHITGGGLIDNIPRCLTKGVDANIDLENSNLSFPIFKYLFEQGISEAELLRTFNCGVGMALVVDKEEAEPVKEALKEEGETVDIIGKLVKSPNRKQEGSVKVRLF